MKHVYYTCDFCGQHMPPCSIEEGHGHCQNCEDKYSKIKKTAWADFEQPSPFWAKVNESIAFLRSVESITGIRVEELREGGQ
jgi:hypothetical protein